MIIECRRCRTKYRFDRESLRGNGAWLRCTRCRHVFFLRMPEEGDFQEKETPVGLEGRKQVPPAQLAAAESVPSPEPLPGESVQETEATVFPEETSSEQANRDLEKLLAEEESDDAGTERPSSLKKLFLFILFLILLAGGFFLLQPETARTLLDRVTVSIQKLLPFSQEKTVIFTAVEEHFLANSAAGRLMVIRGVAMNNTGDTLPLIRIRARIFDSEGKTMREGTSHGGNILTEEELQTLDTEAMAAVLNTPEGRDYPNVQVPPDGTVPFMIVIPDPPENAAEYTIDTVASP